MYRKQVLLEKLREAAASVLPISLIVLAICFVLVPVDTGLMLSFVLATALLILGMGLFTLGAEMSMSKIGNYIGAKLTKSRKLWLILVVSFLLGVAITVAVSTARTRSCRPRSRRCRPIWRPRHRPVRHPPRPARRACAPSAARCSTFCRS